MCNAEKLVFQYSVYILRKALIDEDLRSYIDIAELSHCLFKIYCGSKSKLRKSISTRIYENVLLLQPGKSEQITFDCTTLLKYACTHAPRYGLHATSSQGKSTVWFGVPDFENIACCMVSDKKGSEGKGLYLLILCQDESCTLDSFIRLGENSTEMMMRSECISMVAKNFTALCFSRLASDLLRDSLWETFSDQRTDLWASIDKNPFAPNIANLKRLCLLSQCIDIKEADARVRELFSIENDGLNLDWHKAMRKVGSIFVLLVHEILADRDESHVYLFYSKIADSLIIFEISRHGNNLDSIYFTREGTCNNIVIEQLVTILLKWVWDQT